LKQILINLLGNAIKFTEKGGVTLTVRWVASAGDPPRLQFEVADTGIGMSSEKIKQVFQPFAQADMSDKRLFGGAGLGLSISQHLARLLGGEVTVQSQPGKGSTFTLTIDPGPVELASDFRAELADVRCEQESVKSAPLPKLCGRVLLADDVPEIQRSVSLLLSTFEIEVDIADDGPSALKQAIASQETGSPYDLILMDIQMPGLDGCEVTRRLRKGGWQGPIVALTAHAMTGDEQECLAAGCDGYLSKPFHRAELSAILTKHLAAEA
jgi:CheY-like chemotaxis protein